jgi:FAD:protein FMN transferase
MKKVTILNLIVFCLLFSCSSPKDNDTHFTSIRGSVFGTNYTISYYGPDTVDYRESIDSIFAAFNQSLSYYQKNSLISRVNRNETDSIDDFFEVVFLRSVEIADETNGQFDHTVSPLVNAWGFGFESKSDINAELLDSLREFVGYEKAWLEGKRVVKADARVQFDFNAIAKGYASDVVGKYLESKGISTYLVEIGGDLLAKGVKPDGSKWRIGLERPASSMFDAQEWDHIVEIKDIGLATSGNYRRYYEVDGQRYSHTIDPATAYPVEHSLLSVSVFAPDAMSADGYATAFMVMGLDRAVEFVEARDDLEAYFIYSSNDNGFDTFASSGLNILDR